MSINVCVAVSDLIMDYQVCAAQVRADPAGGWVACSTGWEELGGAEVTMDTHISLQNLVQQ